MREYYTIYRCNLGSFTDFAFRELNPGEQMDDNWHIRWNADLLQRLYTGWFPEMPKRWIFNLPPGFLKTHICSISFPTWMLGRDPRKSVLIISETPDQALEIRERCAELMGSRRYRALFPRTRIARMGRDLELNYGGRIRHAGVGYSLPPRKSDLVIIDNPQSLHSLGRFEVARLAEIGRTLRGPNEGMMVMATRRLGENDLSAYFASQKGWGRIEMPVVAVNEQEWPSLISDAVIQRRGEPLHYWREGWDKIENHIRDMGGEDFSWQYMQGLFRPQTTGERFSHADENGLKWKMVGKFDPTSVTLEDFAPMRAEFEEEHDPIKNRPQPVPE